MTRTLAIFAMVAFPACIPDDTEEICPSSRPGRGDGAQLAVCGDRVEVIVGVTQDAVAGGPMGCATAAHDTDGLRVRFYGEGGAPSLLVVAAEGYPYYGDIGRFAIGFDGTQFVLAWQQKRRNEYADWLGDDLYALRIGADGVAIGDPLVLATTLDDFSTSFSAGLQVSRLGNAAVVAWGQRGADCGSEGCVIARVIDDDVFAPTVTISDPVVLVRDAWRFSMSGGASGSVLAWHEVTGSLRVQTYDLQLGEIGQTPLTLEDLPDDASPDVAGEPGRFAVVWDVNARAIESQLRAVVFDGTLGPIQDLGGGGPHPRVAAVPAFVAGFDRVRWIDDCYFAWDGYSMTLARDDHGEATPVE